MPVHPTRAGAVLALVAMTSCAAAIPAGAADLEVEVSGIRPAAGYVRLGLYDDAKRFPKAHGQIAKAKVRVIGGRTVAVFHDIQPGRYAVALYHDANANGRFDRSTLGLPREGYGFSNDAPAILAAPSFRAAAVEVGEPRTRIAVTMTYWSRTAQRAARPTVPETR